MPLNPLLLEYMQTSECILKHSFIVFPIARNRQPNWKWTVHQEESQNQNRFSY